MKWLKNVTLDLQIRSSSVGCIMTQEEIVRLRREIAAEVLVEVGHVGWIERTKPRGESRPARPASQDHGSGSGGRRQTSGRRRGSSVRLGDAPGRCQDVARAG